MKRTAALGTVLLASLLWGGCNDNYVTIIHVWGDPDAEMPPADADMGTPDAAMPAVDAGMPPTEDAGSAADASTPGDGGGADAGGSDAGPGDGGVDSGPTGPIDSGLGDIHPPGWISPTEHGTEANSRGIAYCQGCHGADLLGGITGVSCQTCHPGFETNCTHCHGDRTSGRAAPPAGVDGETARTDPVVGAHLEHVEATALHGPLDCAVCHVTPASAVDSGHIDGDGVAEVTFSMMNPTGAYDSGTSTCSGLYCHGPSVAGSAVWTDDLTLDCTSCHPFLGSPATELRTMSGEHERHVSTASLPCFACHADVIDSSGALADPDLHVNGSVDISEPSWYPAGFGGRGACTPPCHVAQAWHRP